MSEDQGVTITLKDVYIEVRRLQDTVSAMTPQGLVITDHESRLRGLERWRYSLPVSLVLAIGSAATAVTEALIHH